MFAPFADSVDQIDGSDNVVWIVSALEFGQKSGCPWDTDAKVRNLSLDTVLFRHEIYRFLRSRTVHELCALSVLQLIAVPKRIREFFETLGASILRCEEVCLEADGPGAFQKGLHKRHVERVVLHLIHSRWQLLWIANHYDQFDCVAVINRGEQQFKLLRLAGFFDNELYLMIFSKESVCAIIQGAEDASGFGESVLEELDL